MSKDFSFRLLSYNAYDDTQGLNCKDKEYLVQMFGINELGQTVSLIAENFTPFFYVKVGDDWDISHKARLVAKMYAAIKSNYFKDTIVKTTLVRRKKLYWFDGGKLYKFVRIDFINEQSMRKFKNLWYTYIKQGNESVKKLDTFECLGCNTELYEANIPPLLRMFHVKNINPSGWISIQLKYARKSESQQKTTSCHHEYAIDYKRLMSIPDKETPVPYKICSFDIEASSSHGDFPLAKKNYYKLSQNIVDVWDDLPIEDRNYDYILNIMMTAFGYSYTPVCGVDRVYPKKQPDELKVDELTKLFHEKVTKYADNLDTEGYPDEVSDEENDVDEGKADTPEEKEDVFKYKSKTRTIKEGKAVMEILNDAEIPREIKLNTITTTLNSSYPPLKGDEVTFIGSTFMRYGEEKPYLNHCIVKGTCTDKKQVENSVMECYDTEKQVLLAWTKIIQKEDPDIIIGYNIFGFDYPFMYMRTKELGISPEFLKLSRNTNQICWKTDWKTGIPCIEEKTISISGCKQDIQYIKMDGRLQIDVYNYFRKDYNLIKYKLDYVAGYFIGDKIKSLEHEHGHEGDSTKLITKNLTGLEVGSYINIEEELHTVEQYKDGAKFKVVSINKAAGTFSIEGHEIPDISKSLRWGLAKDDVTPQDIFRMTNEGPDERYIIAKYCLQDCNLVHYLINKLDVITGYTEMASLCSVPIEFLVMRGQGIKSTSYIAKKCREKNTLMPVLDIANPDDAFEGAIVLPPKRDLYIDAVAVNDFSSLYPCSMVSENLSPDSKVSTKSYNLAGDLLDVQGERDSKGIFIYDNLEGYTYVDITYDTYEWRHKTANLKSACEKIKIGYKTCRYAQYPNGELGILPSILQECLRARKTTKKLIPLQTDDFMKNILDKRQLSIKLTANSLYGQTGAKTSTFYDLDVAASTTATGRKLLTFAKRVTEEAYKNRIVPTVHAGDVRATAEYVYGDTDSVFFRFNLSELDGTQITGKKALIITMELAKEAGRLVTMCLKPPHDLEYEKTFMPFCLLSKKRYVGMLYENNPNVCSRKSMGIVLKRRDNAPIVKDIYGRIMDILMIDGDVNKAAEFLQQSMDNLVNGLVPMDKLIIAKSLRGNYKNPKQIAHKVLADRIGRRSPGNKPSNGDRIPYVFFKNKNKKALQGDKIENPLFITEMGLEIDYAHYITNQIMKPVQQVFALVLEKLKGFTRIYSLSLRRWNSKLKDIRTKYANDDAYDRQITTLRNKEVKSLLFDKYLLIIQNKSNGYSSITDYFQLDK